jgi:hypothetical protein
VENFILDWGFGDYYPTKVNHGHFYSVSFTDFDACEAEGLPLVVSTNPSDGETGVSRNLEWISITFNKRMMNGYSVRSSGADWDLSESTPTYWSDDYTFHISRDNIGDLAPNTEITFTLNERDGFRDLDGNLLEDYVFSFTTAN